ncbi:hypothetical protein U9M48_042377 [Paspalum notatum var. saurae]|uniref:Uncharacterized protein n=1 Tax=Paspalum notatum var. saurae TaxID=547442 RepID=A0AAQ3UQE7_PASNO
MMGGSGKQSLTRGGRDAAAVATRTARLPSPPSSLLPTVVPLPEVISLYYGASVCALVSPYSFRSEASSLKHGASAR